MRLLKRCDMPVKKISPDTPIMGVDTLTVGDFWSWAYSDLFSNTTRPLFAEFLVGTALGLIETARVEWNAVDFVYRGKKIEVKQAGYVQSWKQKAPSAIIFDIAKKIPWDAETNVYGTEALRSADCYVFCIHNERERSTANVLNVNAWIFLVLGTHDVHTYFTTQKKVALKRVAALCEAVSYGELKARIETVLNLLPE